VAPYILNALPTSSSRQAVFCFLSHQYNKLSYFISGIMDYFLVGNDHPHVYKLGLTASQVVRVRVYGYLPSLVGFG